MNRVVLARLEDYNEQDVTNAVKRQFDILGGIENLISRGDRVLLKPNFIAPRSHRHATQTHPAIIIAVAKLLVDYGAKPFVGDSPAWSNVHTCAQALRLVEPLQELGVPLRQLSNPVSTHLGSRRIKVGISKHALEADAIINIPKFKSHQQMVATFAIKNMFGCVSGKWKALWHFRIGQNPSEFCEMLIEIYRALSPRLTIIDGIYAMDSQGPINGRTRPLGWIIAGQDPIACEMTCCRLINFDYKKLPLVTAAKQMNFGCSDHNEIELLGDDPANLICHDFIPAEPAPLRFSFAHVCRSITKQMILLTKGKR